MANDLLDQLAQSYVNAIVTGQREPNYLNVPYYLRPPAEALNQNALTEGTIRNASWLDFNPMARSAIDTFMEASGAAPSARLVDRLVKAQSPVLRPQSAYEWADWGAGAAADTIQTGLAGADLAALAPIVGRRAANSLMNELGQVDVWHGSPHRFDNVSHEKIGTGEGGQAFGWGTYYSDLKDVARSYAERLSADARKLKSIASPYEREPKEYAIKKLRQSAKHAEYNGRKRDAREYEATADWIEAGKPEQYSSGALYRAQLFPGKDPSEYTFLDWYEPATSESVKKIKSQAKNEGIKLDIFKDDYPVDWNDFLTRKSSVNKELFSGIEKGFYRVDGDKVINLHNKNDVTDYFKTKFEAYSKIKNHLSNTENIYRTLQNMFGSDKEASLFLKRAGIDGIRYPTETLSGKGPKGGGAYNYVVFDENDVRLVQRESGGVVEDLLKNQQ